MKFILLLTCLAACVVYSQAADIAYGATCTAASDTCPANAECVGTPTKCACKGDSLPETVGAVTKCYKKIGEVTCDDATAPCYTTATCSSAKACYCAAGKTPDANLQKCVTAGAADVVASILSLAVVVVTSRVL